MKFQVGEIAIIWAPGYREHLQECTILQAGPFPAGVTVTGRADPDYEPRSCAPSDYEVENSDGWAYYCDECDLRKRFPPIPEEVLTIFETRKRVETA